MKPTNMDNRYDPKLTRRGILRQIGAVFPAVAMPRRTAMAAEATSSVIATLSTYMSEAHKRLLPDKVIQEAKHHILDTVAAMVSGSELTPGRQAIAFARAV